MSVAKSDLIKQLADAYPGFIRSDLTRLVDILLIEIEGKPNIEVDLVAAEDVAVLNPIFKSFAALKYLIFGSTLDE